ncbi:uncharacterized protein LOC129720003 [Wyeomyia smithii]|uniref:uncharacterized protein LOC129720003 n=1 Tax=Wyeomyia smithii TaxID=174621 RepID=UPI002467BBA1|nr:uncharacterized protein LOC129720003 [Wyeomyia smithii]
MAMSATGEYIPPMRTFPRKRMNEALKVGAPERSIFACNESVWSTTNTFSTWFDHFVAKTKPTEKSPVHLILDGHSSHTENVEVLEKAEKEQVRILSIPPHTSHRLQPLDVTFMGPLKSSYTKALEKFQKENIGKTVKIFNVAAVINSAYSASASISTAKNGFQATGISPYNRHIFTAKDYEASDFLIANPLNDVVDNHPGNYNDLNVDAQDFDGSMHFTEPIDQSTDKTSGNK